jgi:uncharacterized protein (TIGR03437 family)
LYLAHPNKNGIGLYAGTNTVLQNFTVDYLQQHYTQLLITAVNASQRQIQFTVQPGWQKASALNALLNPTGLTETDVFVFRNGQPWASFTRMPVQQPFADDAMTIGSSPFTHSIPNSLLAQIRPGDIAVLTVRTGGAAVLGDGPCNGCTFRNIKIYSGLVGFYLWGQSSLLEHVEVIPKPGTDRLVSTIADGITVEQPGPGNTLRLYRSIRTLDDGISPHAWVFGSAQSARSSRTLQVQGDPLTALGSNRPLPNGSNVVFQRPSDGAILGGAVVMSQTPVPSIGGLPEVVLNFDRDLPNNVTGSYIYSTDASWRGGNLLLERNTVQQQGYARGISLWGVMNTTLLGNYVHRAAMAGVNIQHQLSIGDWLVPPVVNMTVINNVIDGTNTVLDGSSLLELAGIEALAQQSDGSPMTASPHQNITLTGNFIADPARSAIWVGNTTGGTISGNYMFNPNNNLALDKAYPPFSSQLLQPLVLEASQGVNIGVNTTDRTSLRAFVTDAQYRELAAYAPGSTVRLNGFGLGKAASPSISLTDSDGKTWPASITNTSPHSMDFQIPAAAGLGGTVVSMTAGNAKWLGTLFLDSTDNIPTLNQCTYSISPAGAAAPADASTISILVITQSGCSYQVLASDSFVNPGGPGSGTGILIVGLAANSGGARTTVIEIAGQPITLTQAASTGPTITGAVNGASFQAGISAASWITIQGTNLSAISRQWGSGDFVGNLLPTQLDGVSVKVNGIPAYVYYISPAQLNVLTPDDDMSGPVRVQVRNALGDSNIFSVNKVAATPAFFLFNARYPAGVHVNGVNVGPSGLIAGGSFSPAVPGETIELFGTGFGPTNPPSPAGTILGVPASLANSVTVTIGGQPTQVIFAGLTSNGLVQMNVTVPTGLPDGDAAIGATVNGASTQADLFLAIKH